MTPADVLPAARARLLLGAAALAARLPEAPLVAAAEAAAEGWYRLAPARAAQARANLRRVCEGLAATGRGGPEARRAATDDDALERLVRRAFGHAARYYLEVARSAGVDAGTALRRLELDDRADVERALAGHRPVIIVGMHFGALELPSVYIATRLGRRVTGPMEEVADPALRRWFVESRSRVGLDLVPIAGARRPLLRAIREGRSVGLVADRDLTGSGIPVPLFDHPAPIAGGPALLALETGVDVYVGGARRVPGRRYRGRLIHVPAPAGAGSRRGRLVAFTGAIARAMETVIADAPEQWWGAFHPIWPDLVLPVEDR